jgi:hypothetical protein
VSAVVLKNIVFCLACILPLAGCLSQQFKSGLDPLLGKDIQAAIDKLGAPDEQSDAANNNEVYTWGKLPGCELILQADSARRITHWQVIGRDASCRILSIRLL